jgi:DNA-binding NtrC family response regulator
MKYTKHILVIEDDPDITNILIDLLLDMGYRVTTAENAVTALEQLKKEYFDLITLDLRLPDMNGNDLLKELERRLYSLPVIVISANLENLKPNQLVKAAIFKPFDVANVLDTIEQYA